MIITKGYFTAMKTPLLYSIFAVGIASFILLPSQPTHAQHGTATVITPKKPQLTPEEQTQINNELDEMVNHQSPTVDQIHEMLNKGANAPGIHGSVLSDAIVFKNIAVARLLIERGARGDAVKSGGESALGYAAVNNQIEIVHLLLEKGADANTWARSQQSVLSAAVEDGHTEILLDLLSHGANPNGTEHEYAPLTSATWTNQIKFMTLLLDHHADINTTKFSGGYTPLIVAVQHSHPEAVKLLLDRGANPNIKSGHQTARDFAYGLRKPDRQTIFDLLDAKH